MHTSPVLGGICISVSKNTALSACSSNISDAVSPTGGLVIKYCISLYEELGDSKSKFFRGVVKLLGGLSRRFVSINPRVYN